MAIDTTVPNSPGWWMQRLWNQLQAKQTRLATLDAYYQGRPPLPLGSTNQQAAFYKFQRTARTNFAALIVQAACERISVRSVKTAVDSDEGGDETAWSVWVGNDLDVDSAEVDRMAWTFGEAYYALGSPEAEGGIPVITAEDPRQCITACDPLHPRVTIAAFKVYHDDSQDLDLAILWLPGKKFIATRPRKARLSNGKPVGVTFSPTSFTLAPFQGQAPEGYEIADADYAGVASETYELLDVPVVRVCNRGGVGEFELHVDLLDRINHMLLQRVVIATFQAFRQRALKLSDDGDLPEVDDQGQKIDYDDLFSADPGALWKLPAGVDIWESQQGDLSGILNSVKDDVLHLAAVTRTPLTMFTPDAATQSAEGASLQREGLVFKVEDYERSSGRALARVFSIAFKLMGDTERSDLSKISIDWAPAERFSLAEMASADAQALSLPFEDKLRKIWAFTPAEIAQAKSNRADDLIYAQMVAQQQAQAAAVKAAQETAEGAA